MSRFQSAKEIQENMKSEIEELDTIIFEEINKAIREAIAKNETRAHVRLSGKISLKISDMLTEAGYTWYYAPSVIPAYRITWDKP